MRVLHCTRDRRDAAPGRAAERLAHAWVERGGEARLVTAADAAAEGWETDPAGPGADLARTLQELVLDAGLRNETAGRVRSGYPGWVPPARLLDESDLFHLHDVAGFLSPRTISRLLAGGKPVVWSIGDAWPLSGGCLEPCRCRRYADGCTPCPHLADDDLGLPGALWLEKSAAWAGGRLVLAAPTEHVARRAARTPWLRGRAVHVVPWIGGATRTPARAEARLALGVPEGAFVVLVVADRTGAQAAQRGAWRGLLCESGHYNAFRRLQAEGRLAVFVSGVGPGDEEQAPWDARLVRPESGDRELELIRAAADLTVLAHPDENSAEAVQEAAAGGCPVVAYRAGPAADLVSAHGCGALVPTGDLRALAEEVSALALDRGRLEQLARGCAALAPPPVPEGLAAWDRVYDEAVRGVPPGVPGSTLASPPAAPEPATVPAAFLPALRQMAEREMQPDGLAATAAGVLRREAARLKAALATTRRRTMDAEQRLRLALASPAGDAAAEPKAAAAALKRLERRLRLSWVEAHRLEEDLAAKAYEAEARGRAALQVPADAAGGDLLRWMLGDRPPPPGRARLGVLVQHEPRELRLERFPRPRLDPAALPRIAIVTPSFNQGQYLEETLLSVLDQAYPHLACAVQDAGSTDETPEILRRHGARLASWVSAPDTGQARAVRDGFDKLSGDIMAWLNSDDLLMPGALRYVGEYFRRHPEVDAVYGHRVIIDERSREVGRWVLPRHDPDFVRWVDYVPQETLFWRASIWERVGGVDPKFRFALDWDLLLRFQEAGARIVRLPYFLGCFRVHAVQKTSAAMESVGAAEVAQLRRRSLGRLPEVSELSRLHRRAERWSALCRWLLRVGVRW